MTEPLITASHITVAFGDTVALDDFSLEVPQGALVALVGPSGCGKTTALRVIAGFERPSAGTVTIRDTVLMGADQYETPAEIAAGSAQGWPRIGVGDGSCIEGAIVDKNCRIGRDVRIHNESGIANRDVNDSCTVRDGVVVIQKNAVLGDGFCLPG